MSHKTEKYDDCDNSDSPYHSSKKYDRYPDDKSYRIRKHNEPLLVDIIKPFNLNVIKGDSGPKGPRGDKGDRGDRGREGRHGCEGRRGRTGEQGEKGEHGDKGCKGEEGEKGEQGEHGRNAVVEYAYLNGNVVQEVAVDANVLFSNVSVNTANITYLPTGDITLVNAGVFQITYYVQANQVSNLALFLNNVILPDTIYASTATSVNTSVSIVTSLLVNGVLNLRNVSASPLAIATIPVGASFAVNASMTVNQLS